MKTIAKGHLVNGLIAKHPGRSGTINMKIALAGTLNGNVCKRNNQHQGPDNILPGIKPCIFK
jgi:hypothetical protein